MGRVEVAVRRRKPFSRLPTPAGPVVPTQRLFAFLRVIDDPLGIAVSVAVVVLPGFVRGLAVEVSQLGIQRRT